MSPIADYNLGTARGTIELTYKGGGPEKAKEELDKTKKSGMDAGQALDRTAKTTAVAGTVMAAGLAVAVNSAASFEQRLSAIEAVSGATAREMDRISDKALQLGKDTAFSASESAQAMEELVKAGLTVDEVLNGAADATVNLAAAGEVALPEAASLAANAMSQFNLAAEDLPSVADAIAGAANASAIDVSEFGQSLSQAGAVANLAGVDFDDTATSIALLGNAGIKGSDAGTSLKSMLSRLQPTTKAQTTLMEELGIITMDAAKAQEFLRDKGIKPLGKDADTLTGQLKDYAMEMAGVDTFNSEAQAAFRKLGYETQSFSNQFYDANGNLRSMSEVSGVLEKSLEGMTAQQKQAALQTLFGSDAIRAAAILADAGADGFDKMAESIGKVSAADVAKTRMDNLKGSIEEMKGSVETLAIQLGTVFIPMVRDLVDAISAVVGWFTDLSPAMQKTIAIVAAAGASFLLFTAALIKFYQFVKAARATYAALMLAMNGSKILGPVVALFKKVTLAVRAFSLALLTNPIFLIIAAIVALIAIFVLLYKKNETVRNVINSVWAAIKSAISSVVDWLVGTAWPALQAVWAGIVMGITFMSTAVKTVLAALLAAWQAVWGLFGPVVTAVWNLIKAIVQLGLAVLMFYIGTTLKGIQLIFSTIWNAIVGVTRAVWGTLRGIVSGALNAIKAVVGGPLSAVRGAVSAAWGAVKSATSSLWNGLRSTVSGAVDRMMGVIRGIKDKVMGPFRSAGTWLVNAGKAIIQGLLDGIGKLINKVTDKLKALTDKIPKVKGPESRDKKLLRPAGRWIMEGFDDEMSDGAQRVLRNLATLNADIPATIDPTVNGSISAAVSATRDGQPISSPSTVDSGPRRMILEEGKVDLTSRSTAMITGVFVDANEQQANFEQLVGV